MITRIASRVARVRRWLSRSEWALRLLRLPRTGAHPLSPGLVMIQIDGLSHRQLARALADGNMPFLHKLLQHEHYRLHHLYSGLPSSTPAVQGELFYGVKNAVPSFSFFDRTSGTMQRMYEPASAAAVEQRLARHGAALLDGGSAYSNIFTGGAAEAHFCPAALGWGPLLRAANPMALAVLMVSHAWSVVRIAALMVLELVLALVDSVRGVVLGHRLVEELRFIATRVGICILLRELVTIGTKIDIARGLPIIHLNLLGYDEQAHRRGPASRFAHWALKGIDDAIARIWRAAHRAGQREYEVWIYADHGQEHVLPYANVFGQPVEQAIAAVFQAFENVARDVTSAGSAGIQAQRARLLGGGRQTRRLFPLPPEETAAGALDQGIGLLFPAGQGTGSQVINGRRSEQLSVAAMGPLGQIYYSRVLDEPAYADLARQLVARAGLPLVLRARADGQVRAWTAQGEFVLPQDSAEVLGEAHPFRTEAADDLVALCRHVDAGDLVFSGWRQDAMSYTFPFEHGSHAGPGSEETDAFALLPADTSLPRSARGYLRAGDLRGAARHLLGRETAAELQAQRTRGTAAGTLRIMTYNVHSCIGMDGKLSPERIARVIARHEVDVVCLQELDVGRARTGGVDQAEVIAQCLEMQLQFHPAIHLEEERYGDAILTALPMRLVKADKLPTLAHKPGLEPRGALWVVVEFDGHEIQIVNTHLGLLPRERVAQVDALVGARWLGHAACQDPVVLCGDLNALPSSPTCRRLNRYLRDAQIALADHRPRNTFFGPYPTARIDHVYVSRGVAVQRVEVARSRLAQLASDHLPLIVDIALPTAPG